MYQPRLVLMLGITLLWSVAPANAQSNAPSPDATRIEGMRSPLEIDTAASSIPGRAEIPPLAPREYVMPPVEVRAFRTLSETEFPLLAWTDTDTRGVHRTEAEATSLRVALHLGWLNPFNW